jgi:hypothetical protein
MSERPEFEQDNQPTNQRCPNGHITRVHVTAAAGQGREFCPECNWDDSQTAGSAEGEVSHPREKITRGVRILSAQEDTDLGKKGVTTISGRP